MIDESLPLQFSVTFGKQTFSKRSSVNWVDLQAKDSVTGVMKKYAINDYKKEFGYAKTKAMSFATPASVDGYEGYGAWYTYHLPYPADPQVSALAILAGKDTANGALRAQAAILVRLRATGPLIRVAFKPSPHHLAALSTVSSFYGRGDVLSIKEARDYGAILPEHFLKNYFDPEEIEELFMVEEEAEELDAKPQFTVTTNSAGEAVKVLVPKAPIRRLRIRRN